MGKIIACVDLIVGAAFGLCSFARAELVPEEPSAGESVSSVRHVDPPLYVELAKFTFNTKGDSVGRPAFGNKNRLEDPPSGQEPIDALFEPR